MGIEIPKIEIRYEHLVVEGDVHVGARALPTLLNSTFNSIEVFSYFNNFSIIKCWLLILSKKKLFIH